MKHRSVLAAYSIAAAIVLWGCGHAAVQRGSHLQQVPKEALSESTLADYVRVYHAMERNHPQRPALRQKLSRHWANHARQAMARKDYEGVVSAFQRMMSLYTPAEMNAKELDPSLDKVARYLVEQGGARGDESRVLAALMVLRLRGAEDGRSYETLVQWGRQAREMLPSRMEKLSRLIDLWEDHANLSPAPSVLAQLSRLHIERRNLALQMMEGPELPFALPEVLMRHRAQSLQPILLRAPLDVAAIYLKHGDVDSAIRQIRAMTSGKISTEARLLSLLEKARLRNEEGEATLYDLGEVYRRMRPDVALGICRMGQRRFEASPLFPLCLGRLAAAEQESLDAAVWYGEAIERAPADRRIYDEALAQLHELLERDLLDNHPSTARRLVARTEAILEARLRRWPKTRSPLGRHELQLLVGLLEMNLGNAKEAQRRLEASIAAKETPAALMQLGLLSERTGKAERAAELYARALKLIPAGSSAESAVKRAEILEHLGDALRKSGRQSLALGHYREALALWEKQGADLEGAAASLQHVRRGVLFDRLGQHPRAVEAFRNALLTAPDWKEPYATILSHLVVAVPDVELATEVFRKARRHLSLEPEWKVYFALWVATVASRAGQKAPEDAFGLLQEMASGRQWWGYLAKFGTGQLPYDRLVHAASETGQYTEAHFYEGIRLLSQGDRRGAEALFRRVLETHMVSFYEFAMAEELIYGTRGGKSALPTSAPLMQDLKRSTAP